MHTTPLHLAGAEARRGHARTGRSPPRTAAADPVRDA